MNVAIPSGTNESILQDQCSSQLNISSFSSPEWQHVGSGFYFKQKVSGGDRHNSCRSGSCCSCSHQAMDACMLCLFTPSTWCLVTPGNGRLYAVPIHTFHVVPIYIWQCTFACCAYSHLACGASSHLAMDASMLCLFTPCTWCLFTPGNGRLQKHAIDFYELSCIAN